MIEFGRAWEQRIPEYSTVQSSGGAPRRENPAAAGGREKAKCSPLFAACENMIAFALFAGGFRFGAFVYDNMHLRIVFTARPAAGNVLRRNATAKTIFWPIMCGEQDI